jgi:hypothetical protein
LVVVYSPSKPVIVCWLLVHAEFCIDNKRAISYLRQFWQRHRIGLNVLIAVLSRKIG